VQVNRGGGILYAYYAKNSFKSSEKFKEDNDYEKQAHIKLTRDELIDIALSGEIGEAQWAATAALALLYEEHKEDHPEHINSDGLKESKEHRNVVPSRGTRAVPAHFSGDRLLRSLRPYYFRYHIIPSHSLPHTATRSEPRDSRSSNAVLRGTDGLQRQSSRPLR
jgi:hypothetical protein